MIDAWLVPHGQAFMEDAGRIIDSALLEAGEFSEVQEPGRLVLLAAGLPSGTTLMARLRDSTTGKTGTSPVGCVP